MNRSSIERKEIIINFLTSLDECQKQTMLRNANIGYDINKEPGLKQYRRMTVGHYLATVASYNNVPDKLFRIVEALMANPLHEMSTYGQTSDTYLTSVAKEPSEYAPVAKVIPSQTASTFCARAKEIIETLINAMQTLNATSVKNSERLSLSYDMGMSDLEIAQSTSVSSARVNQIRRQFQNDILNGVVQMELSDEYTISTAFVEEAKMIAAMIENRTLEFAVAALGATYDNHLRFIFEALGLKNVIIGNKAFLLKFENIAKFRRMAGNITTTLNKQFDYVPLTSFLKDSEVSTTSFLTNYILSQPDVYELSQDKTAVRMIGEGLSKSARVARIIFEAGNWIGKDEIATRYKSVYHEDMGSLDTNALGKMGFASLGNTGKWRFGSAPDNIQRLIRSIITPERPLATLNTIVRAAEKEGLEYPLSTIRTYITDIATPENKQPDLFCLKGYCHLYPTYSWRSYRKETA